MAVTKDDVKVGDTVKVAIGGRRSRNYVDAIVTGVARVWLTAQEDRKYAPTYRMRLDTQNDGDGQAYGACFWTLEQWEKLQADIAASKFLREQGITLDYGSPWFKRRKELADLIKKGSQ